MSTAVEMRITALLALALTPFSQITAQITRPVRAASNTAVPPNLPNPVRAMKIAPQTFSLLEKRFDGELATIGGPNDPLDLLGATRGLYLDGYGAVFTAELSLIITPTVNPFRKEITKEEAARVHQRKVERLPVLKRAMAGMMRNSAMTLIQIPDNQQIVLAVRLLYLPWEDTTDLPAQVMMSATRRGVLNGDVKTEDQ
jgi:hypothetical protein